MRKVTNDTKCIEIEGKKVTKEMEDSLVLPVIPAGNVYLSQREYMIIVADYIGRKYGRILADLRQLQVDKCDTWKYRLEIERISERDQCSNTGSDNLIIGFILRITDYGHKLKEKKVYLAQMPKLPETMTEMLKDLRAYVGQMVKAANDERAAIAERQRFVRSFNLRPTNKYQDHEFECNIADVPAKIRFAKEDDKEVIHFSVKLKTRTRIGKLIKALRS